VYLSSHRRADHLAADEQVVKRFGFPPGPVCGRRDGETYGELVSRLSPDLVVEDDCESIGGLDETIAAQLDQAARRSIPCLMLPEFGGFGHLPDDPAELARMQHMT
jgi:hypothetical protein